MSSAAPHHQSDSSDKLEDEQLEQLLLSSDQAKLIQAVRENLRRCETNEGKFRICAEARSQLLEQHTQFELLIALFERVMLVECPGYRSWRRKKNVGLAHIDAEDERDRFIGVAKCTPLVVGNTPRSWERDLI
ncbi:hypothetical protein QBC38DRAFT_378462 [Podospora fimiseda]|uniref:Uncharacterized protein n=1 Tax=Podospora fimiseda TaxID=252190 RepID=A0AAN6YLH1_9PEZI|nr:hypothetical protein QBC38DRAFT_378462 [Podospora fimiseda]